MPELQTFERLPKSVVPKHYQVSLQPDLKACTFKGCVKIDLDITRATKHVVLNSLRLTINSVSLSVNDDIFKPTIIDLCTTKETLTLGFDNEIQPGSALLDIKFEGELNDKLKGFYRNKYTVGSEDRFGAVSQFESTDARLCFPCWDEPATKATFDVILTVPNDRVALSNMNVEMTMPHPTEKNWNIVKFARSPIMSTYLLAFVVGEYDYVEEIMPSGVVVRVYTPLNKKEQGLFALQVTAKVLSYYEQYFNIKYPLPKLDQIAISDFSVGAMENWGLITYREIYLLVDPQNTSTNRKQSIVTIIAHEIAHQWFGNLVTMEWWTHLWLNEGYATFAQYLCTHELFPEYEIWTQFVSDSFFSVLNLDALKNSHPIEVPVGHPAEVEEIFDQISYDKGASVIRMLHNYIGDEDFRKGMHTYLDRHKYGNTETTDLWLALSEASKKPIADVMSCWTQGVGFPLISVTSKQEGSNRILTLTQNRFMADGSTPENSEEWMVPMTFLSPSIGSKPKNQLLDSKTDKVVLENVYENDWVKINVNSFGFYRVKYSTEMLQKLIEAVSSKALSPIDRLGVIDDLFALVQSGGCSTVEILGFLKSYVNETDFTVWSTVNNIFYKINHILSHTSYQHLFKIYARKLLANIFAKLGWEAKQNESHLDALLRPLVLVRLGLYGEEAVVEEAKKRFNDHIQEKAILPADLRGPVYRTVMTVADETIYNQMIVLYRKAELHEEKRRIITSLGSTSDPILIQKIIDFSMSDEVRSQDSGYVVTEVSNSVNGRVAAWNFLKANLSKLQKTYDGGPLLVHLIRGVTEKFASEEMALEIEKFFSVEKVAEAERTIKQSAEYIRLNEEWLKRDSAAIETFLKKQCSL